MESLPCVIVIDYPRLTIRFGVSRHSLKPPD
jgi:hypothetical protein